MAIGVSTIRVPDVETPVATSRPAGGSGSRIYCVDNYANTAVDPFLTLPLTERATVNVQIIWMSTGSASTISWSINGVAVETPTPGASLPSGAVSTRAITTATTLDPGACVIQAFGSAPTEIMIVAIVGDNTEDDCVVYDLGCS